jgi:hypothetical protein
MDGIVGDRLCFDEGGWLLMAKIQQGNARSDILIPAVFASS